MVNDYTDRYDSFCRCLEDLCEVKNRDVTDSFVLSGTVQKFDLTFDLAWKTMKDIVTKKYEVTDFATGSPRETLKKAYSLGMIEDDRWMDMLRLRNELVHDYDQTIARNAVNKIKEEYLGLFKDFEEKIKKL